MEYEVRLADGRDRTALDRFYTREGMDFRKLSRYKIVSAGATKETMYIIAVTQEAVIAALKLDIAEDPGFGNIGYIQHFEIEDELEETDLGAQMISRTIEIAEKKKLRALDAVVNDKRQKLIEMYLGSQFHELDREVRLRREFRKRLF